MKVTYKYQKKKPSTPHEVRYWIPPEKDLEGNILRKGRYKRHYKKTRAEAIQLRQVLEKKLKAQGIEGIEDTEEAKRMAAHYKSALALIPEGVADGITLHDIVREWLSLTHRTLTPKPLDDALTEFETFKKPHVSSSYLKSRIVTPSNYLRKQLTDLSVHDIGEDELKELLEEMHLEYSEETVNDRLIVYRSFFDWCVEKGYTRINPAAKIPKQFVRDGTPRHLPAADVEKLFLQALKEDPDIIPALALNFFGFLRPTEVTRIVTDYPEDIRKEARQVFVRKEVTKGIQGKRRSRLIEHIPFPLWKWITEDAPLSVSGFVARRKKLYDDAGIEWFNSAARHCCLTYACQLENPSRVADLSGHVTQKTAKENYRGIVEKKEAEAYAGITPAKILSEHPEIALPSWLQPKDSKTV